jgi:hypothetical protein
VPYETSEDTVFTTSVCAVNINLRIYLVAIFPKNMFLLHQASVSNVPISAEFPELTLEQRPMGLAAKCYLGAPYEVHICNLSGNIERFQEKWNPVFRSKTRQNKELEHLGFP